MLNSMSDGEIPALSLSVVAVVTTALTKNNSDGCEKFTALASLQPSLAVNGGAHPVLRTILRPTIDKSLLMSVIGLLLGTG